MALADYMTIEDWMAQAECESVTPTDVFFDKKYESVAKQICRYCNVKQECLNYAVRHGITFGIWGGLNPRQRKRYMKR